MIECFKAIRQENKRKIEKQKPKRIGKWTELEKFGKNKRKIEKK